MLASKVVALTPVVKTSFELGLKTGIIPEKAINGTPTLTRSSIKTVTDFEGLIKTCKAGEIVETGARRVENLLLNSKFGGTIGVMPTSWSNSGNGTPVLVSNESEVAKLRRNATGLNGIHQSVFTSGKTYAVRIKVRKVSGVTTTNLYAYSSATTLIASAATINAQTTGVWVQYSVTIIAGAAYIGFVSTSGSDGDGYDLSEPQIEEVTGQTNQAPSEYVPSTENSTGALGVKYFSYLNGNTVVDNVVVESQGAAIPEATMKGGLIEGTDTNYFTQSADINLWTKSNVTVSDSGILSPVQGRNWQKATVDATAATAIHKVVTGVGKATGNTLSFYVKKGSSTNTLNRFNFYNVTTSLDIFRGSIYYDTGVWTTSGGTGNAVVTPLGNNAYKVELTNLSGVADGDTLRCYLLEPGGVVTAGAYAFIIEPQLNKLPFATSLISTTTAAITRAADVLSYPTACNLNAASGGIYLEFTPEHAPSGTVYLFGSYVDANNSLQILHNATNLIARKRIAGTNYDATIANAFVAGTKYKIAIGWGNSGIKFVLDGAVSNVIVPVPELIANGNFDTNIDSWIDDTGTDGTISWLNSALRITRDTVNTPTFVEQYITSFEIGSSYNLSLSFSGNVNSIIIRVGTTAKGYNVLDSGAVLVSSLSKTYQFIATSALLYVSIAAYTGGIGTAVDIDNVSITKVSNINSTAAPLGTTIQVGADGNGAGQPFAEICNIKFYKKEPKVSKLISLTR
jgi:hypothetical protein